MIGQFHPMGISPNPDFSLVENTTVQLEEWGGATLILKACEDDGGPSNMTVAL